MKQTAKQSVGPSTYIRYEQLVRVQLKPYLGKVLLAELCPDHIEQMFEDQTSDGHSPSSKQKAAKVLQIALKIAVRKRFIPHNLMHDVDKPRVEKSEMQVLTVEETERFLEATKADRLHVKYVMALGTGMRQGELFGLSWKDIDFERCQVSFNGRWRRYAANCD